MMIMMYLSLFQNSVVEIYSHWELSGFKYASNFALLSGNPIRLQVSLNRVSSVIGFFRKFFACPSCGLTFQDLIGSNPNLVLRERIELGDWT